MYQTNSSRNTKKEIILMPRRKFKANKEKKELLLKEKRKIQKTQFLVILVWSAAPEDNCSRGRGKTRKRGARTNGVCGWHKWVTLQTLLLSVEKTF